MVPLTSSCSPATPTSPVSARLLVLHLFTVITVCLVVLAPTYWIDEAQQLRPSRALGSLGLQWPGQDPLTTPPDSPQANVQPPFEAPHGENATSQVSMPVAVIAPPPLADAPLIARTQPEDGRPPVDLPHVAAPKSGGVDIEGLEHLEAFFKALRKSGSQPVRVMHYGDSTLAGDGIAKTVRLRMKAAFGDAGPGFFVAGMDPRWMRRDDVRISRDGQWDIHTILYGGNQGRYGLGGVVAKPKGTGQIHVSGPKAGTKLGQRVEIYANKSARSDAVRLTLNGAQVTGLEKLAHPQFDQYFWASGADVESLKIVVAEPGLEIYGAVVEAGQGITWETTAVVGIASGSIRQFNVTHLAGQTAVRRPELIVIMLGGNETGHPGLNSPDGASYKNGFSNAVRTLRQGAPQASCLIMSPLDQGVLADNGQIYSRKTMPQMVRFQREVALEMGCAFWDSWQFMGGNNSFSRWLRQGLAWTDLVHLTEKGLAKIGNGFADALMNAHLLFQEGR